MVATKAIREAVYALDTLKADGIKLATNVQGQYLTAEPDFAPYRDMVLWKNARRLFPTSP